MERLKDFELSWYTKLDLIDLLEEYPNLFEMTAEELRKLAREKYWTAEGYFDRGNRLESDADAINKYCNAKYGEEHE